MFAQLICDKRVYGVLIRHPVTGTIKHAWWTPVAVNGVEVRSKAHVPLTTPETLEVSPPNHQTEAGCVLHPDGLRSLPTGHADHRGRSPEPLVLAIAILSEISAGPSSKPSIPRGLNPLRARPPSYERCAGLLDPVCKAIDSSTRSMEVISLSDQPPPVAAAFLRESISRVIMIGRKTSFPTAGRSWRTG